MMGREELQLIWNENLTLKIALPQSVSLGLQEHQYQTDWWPLTSLEHRPPWPAEDRPPYLPKLTYSPFWNTTDINNYLSLISFLL